jgi:hypothetical protein
MVVETRRYLADSLKGRVHDADHEQPECELGALHLQHRRWHDTLGEALDEAPYEPCPRCLGSASGSAGVTARRSRST